MSNQTETMRGVRKVVRQINTAVHLQRILKGVGFVAAAAFLLLTPVGRDVVLQPLIDAAVKLPVFGVALAVFFGLFIAAMFIEGIKMLLVAIAYGIGFFVFAEGGKLVLDDAMLGGWFYHWLTVSLCLVMYLARRQGQLDFRQKVV